MKIIPRTKRGKAAAAVGTLAIFAFASPSDPKVPTPDPVVALEVEPSPTASPSLAPVVAPSPTTVYLRAASGGDGDSWKTTDGREIRLGLVNTPEIGGRDGVECYGPEASDRRKALTDKFGFTVDAYSVDNFDREVSVVTLEDGRNLNVLLAQEGYANDRYFAEFRSENPALATQLDAAFADAKAARRGLWGDACAPKPKPAPVEEAPAVQGPFPNCKAARAAGAAPVRRGDPGYSSRIDRDGDGVACE